MQAAQQFGNIEERLPVPFDNNQMTAPGTITLPPPSLREGRPNTFVLTAVEISGASVFTPEQFSPLYENFLARSVTLSDITTLVESMTALYREKGYFLSRAVAPQQNAAFGILHIDISEGFISEIAVRGEGSEAIKRQLEKLTRERPARLATLERTLALIGDLAGVSVASSQIEPDPDILEKHKLIVTVEVDHLSASLYMDNRGANTAGPIQAYAQIAGASLLKTGDQLSASVFFIPGDFNELLLGEISYHLPLTNSGTYATISGMISHFDAGASLASLDIENKTKRITLSLSHPIIRRSKMSLWGNIGIEGRNINEIELGAPQYDDKLRIVFASAAFRHDHFNGVTSVFGKASQGVNMLSASNGGAPLSRADADGEFTKFNTQISRYQNIGNNFGLYASFAGQTSLDPLLASEEFSLGGPQYGRAYDYGELTGDDGIASLVEFRYGRNPDFDFLDFYQLYGFYDYGVVWNDNAAPGFKSFSLSSAGAGLRLTFPSSLRATVEIAKPLDHTPFTQNDKDWRGFFSVSKDFW